MILAFDSAEVPAHFATRPCIIRAAAAGSAIALEFAGTRQRAVVLESGSEQPEPETARSV